MKKILTILALTSILVASPIMAKSVQDNKQVAFHVIKASMLLTKKDVTSVKLIRSEDNNYLVEITLAEDVAKRFSTMTGSNIHLELMIGLGKQIINKATIQDALGPRFEIGGLSKSSAENIIKALS